MCWQQLIKFFILSFIVICVTGCSAEVHEPLRPISALNYYNFFIKSREFLVVCSALISQENPQLKQIISRVYYSYFFIARTVHIGKTNKYEKVKHDIIWGINKKEVRKQYGEDLKKLRTYYDYDPSSVNEEIETTNTNLRFISENEEVYKILITDAKCQLHKFYKHEEHPQEWIEKTTKVIESLEKDHEEFASKIRNIAPVNGNRE